jgi:hypothetical protein
VGYIIKFEEIIVYQCWNSDAIPEMQKLTGYKQPNKEFIVLLPIGGRFTIVQKRLLKCKNVKTFFSNSYALWFYCWR